MFSILLLKTASIKINMLLNSPYAQDHRFKGKRPLFAKICAL